MDLALGDYLRFLFALLFVLGLIGGFALLGKRFGFGNRGPTARGTGRRLAIVETLALDAKRRLVLVRRDAAEHLILIGAAGEQVVEADIASDAETSRDRPALQAVPLRPEAAVHVRPEAAAHVRPEAAAHVRPEAS